MQRDDELNGQSARARFSKKRRKRTQKKNLVKHCMGRKLYKKKNTGLTGNGPTSFMGHIPFDAPRHRGCVEQCINVC